MSIYRQGDVLIIKTDKEPEGREVPRENGRVVLAHGEATGHAHAILEKDVVLFESGNTRILAVESGADLVHEEHSAIHLPKGFYEIRRQREFDAGEIRRVAD